MYKSYETDECKRPVFVFRNIDSVGDHVYHVGPLTRTEVILNLSMQCLRFPLSIQFQVDVSMLTPLQPWLLASRGFSVVACLPVVLYLISPQNDMTPLDVRSSFT